MIGGKKKCIGLIFGGNSNEHEVSISSAKTVFQAFKSELNKERFTVKAFYINKYGVWLDTDSSEKILINESKNNNFNFSLGDEIDVRINEARPFSLTGQLHL